MGPMLDFTMCLFDMVWTVVCPPRAIIPLSNKKSGQTDRWLKVSITLSLRSPVSFSSYFWYGQIDGWSETESNWKFHSQITHKCPHVIFQGTVFHTSFNKTCQLILTAPVKIFFEMTSNYITPQKFKYICLNQWWGDRILKIYNILNIHLFLVLYIIYLKVIFD